MLARKLKCVTCGANKVNELKSSYIFCDYCASFMGYEFTLLGDETKKAFDMEYFTSHNNTWPPETTEYLDATQKMAAAMQTKDTELFISSFIRYQDVAMKILPGNYSPKMKNATYKAAYLKYLEALFRDKIEDGYFEEVENNNKRFADAYAQVKTEVVDGKPMMTYDENFEKYIDEIFAYCRESAAKTVKYPSINLFPDEMSPAVTDMILKQGVSPYAKMLKPEDFEKLVKYLGFQTEYIEIPDVKTIPQNCAFCAAELKIPEGAKFVMCEYCGNKNQAGAKAISCANCGATFDPDAAENRNKCPYCSSLVQAM